MNTRTRSAGLELVDDDTPFRLATTSGTGTYGGASVVETQALIGLSGPATMARDISLFGFSLSIELATRKPEPIH